MDEIRIPPAGDPFYAEAHRPDPAPHGCYSGLVYLGRLELDPETGAEFEVIGSVACRRCGAARL